MKDTPNKKAIQDWLINRIAALLGTEPGTLDLRAPFTHYGLSSREAVQLSGELEEWLDRRLSPTLAYEHPGIEALAHHLAHPEGDTVPPTPATPALTVNEPIAVIGMACRFPGADSPEAFWELIRSGTDQITEVPADRWPRDAYYHPDPSVPGKAVSYWGGFLDRIDQFDPYFFGISPHEAKQIDPQQRLLLELSQEALDDAGQTRSGLDGSPTGVFIGISVNEYSHFQLEDPLQITSHSGTGSALSISANRLSYFFNFRGPSMAIDTACSSSLTAVHLACQSLRNGECKQALAGGVNLILSPAHSIAFSKAGVLAPDGRCKTFDANANGYVRGEGGGIVVLKPLSAALAAGDPILAVIRGSAIHQDGRTNGLMAPSQESQEALLRAAYQAAGVSPAEVQYVEAHGTGTLLGDAMEAGALGKVIGAAKESTPVAIGSVKTNIGHLEAAAGIAGLIKVIMALKNSTLPPSLHYQSPNPHLDFDALNLQVQTTSSPWPSESEIPIAGVSSFGFGGTNGHLVVTAPPSQPFRFEVQVRGKMHPLKNLNSEPEPGSPFLLPLAAHGEEALRGLVEDFIRLLREGESSLAELCYAAGARRSGYSQRIAVLGNSREGMANSLKAFLAGETDPQLYGEGMAAMQSPGLVFVFPGQGGQWIGMGQELLRTEPVFYEALERIDLEIQAHFEWSLLDELQAPAVASRLHEIGVVQPAIFAIQVGLAALLKSRGIVPDAVVGHSMGEVAAAHVAGILTIDDAVQIICVRSQLLRAYRGKGSMLVTELSPEKAEELLKGYEGKVALAVVNSPSTTVLSGDSEKVTEIMHLLEAQDLFCKPVNVDVASHSPQMDPLRAELLEQLDFLYPLPEEIPFYSTVTGKRAENLEFDAAYWVDNLREPVWFSTAIGNLLNDGHSLFVEIGPHPVLLGSIQQCLQPEHQEIRLLATLRREEPEQENLLGTLAALYTVGREVDWEALYPHPGRHVPLPPIRWQHQRYWLDQVFPSTKNTWQLAGNEDKQQHPLLGERVELAHAPDTYVWQSTLQVERLPWLADHQIEDRIVFPAAGYLEMALTTIREAKLPSNTELSQVTFLQKMDLEPGQPRFLQTVLTPNEEGNPQIRIYSRTSPQKSWTLNATAGCAAGDPPPIPESALAAIRQGSTLDVSGLALYQSLHDRGIQYGPAFRGIEQVWSQGAASVGRVILPESLAFGQEAYLLHPALLDACLQVLAATSGAVSGEELYLPSGCGRVRWIDSPVGEVWSEVSLHQVPESGADRLLADIRLWDDQGNLLAELSGFQLKRIYSRKNRLEAFENNWLYELDWRAQTTAGIPLSKVESPRNWLLFADDAGYADALAGQLQAAGDRCLLIPVAEAIAQLENHPPEALAAWIAGQVDTAARPIYGIVHLWSCSEAGQSQGLATDLDGNTVLYLLQTLTQEVSGSPRLWLVTAGAQAVQAEEQIQVEPAPLWGLGKVISFELPEFKCVRVDLDPQSDPEDAIIPLWTELSLESQEDQIAFRSGERFVHRLVPYPRLRTLGSQEVVLRQDGTYLITGGLGGLGLSVAKWMNERGAGNLVLLGRSAPSPEAERVVEQMEAAGTQVMVLSADVSDAEQMEIVFMGIQETLPPLRGVVHAAGLLDDGSLLNLDRDRMVNVLAPKVAGTRNLHAGTRDLELDFFVLFSSAVSVLGAPGQGNYAAGSAFLDAMAYHRQREGLPAMSINWGPWGEVGLAAAAAERLEEQNANTQHLVKVIEVAQGLEILEALLTDPTPQVVVLPFDLKNLLELYPTAAGMAFFAEVGGSDTHVSKRYARPNLRQAYVAPRSEVEKKLAALWEQTLHIDKVGIHDSFFELGGDSVLAAQVLSMARKTYGISIKPQDAFQAFTIERLAAMLEAELMKEKEIREVAGIPKRPEGSELPLSFPQQRQLFLELLDRGTAVNNLSVLIALKGDLDLEALEKSANQILARHESLRTQFAFELGTSMPAIAEQLSISLPLVEVGGKPNEDPETIARNLAEREILLPFDLTQAPLIRLKLYRVAPTRHLLLLCAHHTIADGWSLGVLLQELMQFYSAHLKGTPPQLPELTIGYPDYAYWQIQEKRLEALQSSLEYWKKQLGGDLPVLELPTDFPRGSRQTFTGGTYRFELDSAFTAALEKMGQQEGATLFMTLLTGFFVVLHRYSGQEDLLVGTPVANRNLPEIQHLIGVFINTLVLRVELKEQPGFLDLLRQVKTTALEAYAHQDLPFEKLVEELKPRRDLSRTPLFQVVFNLQSSPLPELKMGELETEFVELDRGVSQFDLTLMISKIDGACQATVEYNSDLFSQETVAHLFGAFQLILREALAHPDLPVAQLPLAPAEEITRLVRDLNQTPAEVPSVCFPQLFEAQVRQTPESVALMYKEQSLTYRELNQQANALARKLQTLGIQKEQRVAVLMKRSPELLVALLAVMKAGGAYVPLHTSFPEERIRYILEDAEVQVLLTNTEVGTDFAQDFPVLMLGGNSFLGEYAGDDLPPQATTAQLAYLIYTSGSTGTPKGVMVDHAPLVNFLWSMKDRPGMKAGEVLMAVTSVSFDIAGLELYLPLLVGATVCLASEEMLANPVLLADALESYQVNRMQATPATWQLLLKTDWKGKKDLQALCGGEALPRKLADQLLDRVESLWNMYGPTETTIWSSVGEIQPDEAPISIGQPIYNTQLYILDRHLQPVPRGVVGELHIGGEGLARGYVNLPELTREQFIQDPFADRPGARLYKTGDHARFLADGFIEVLGRMDEQVKLNGHRMELGEIASVMLEHPAVQEAVVILRQESYGAKRLMGYFVAHTPMEAEDLRAFVRRKLPAYMTPTFFIGLDALPLSPNGKIDRKGLPVPEDVRELEDYVAPQNEEEKILVEIWQNVLSVEQIGIHDNFFELGGASIQSLQIVGKANMYGFKLGVDHLFEYQTIQELAEFIQSGYQDIYSES